MKTLSITAPTFTIQGLSLLWCHIVTIKYGRQQSRIWTPRSFRLGLEPKLSGSTYELLNCLEFCCSFSNIAQLALRRHCTRPRIVFVTSQHRTSLTVSTTDRHAIKQRAKILRGLDRLKKGASEKFEKEQLKTLEEDLAQYVVMRLIESRAHLTVALDSDSDLSKPSRKIPPMLSKKTQRMCCGNFISLSTWPIESLPTVPSAARSTS